MSNTSIPTFDFASSKPMAARRTYIQQGLSGEIKGPQFTPYAFVFRSLIKPRLKSPLRTEDVRPPKFAQSIGLAFALVAIVGAATGTSVVFSVAVATALAAAFLNAAFDFCLGCQVYLILARIRNA